MKDKETRQYIIPLRKESNKSPKWRRTKKAVSVVRSFLIKHTKADKIVIGKWLNEELWENGIRNPPARVKVTVNTKKIKDKKDDKKEILVAEAELSTLPVKAKRLEEKEKKVREAVKKLADKDKGILEKAKSDLKSAKEEKTSEKAESKKEEPEKKEEKEVKKKAKVSKKQEMSMSKK